MEINIIVERLDCNVCEYIRNDCKISSENLIESLKIYCNYRVLKKLVLLHEKKCKNIVSLNF